MHFPFTFSLGVATAFASVSTAHTIFTTLFINDVSQGDGTCIRMPKEGNVCTFPIAGGLDTPDMACGRDGQQSVAFTCPTPAGAKLTLEFRLWADASQPGSIDPSHLGSTAIYLKPVSNMSTDSAAGPGWFKIYAEGYDTTTKKWATEKLIDNHGLLSVDLPPGLPTGYYLSRSEIITIQNVTDDHVAPQFYVGCAQLFIQGTSSEPLNVPANNLVSIPGHVHATDPGLTFNIWRDDPSKTPYRVVGPDPFFPTAQPQPQQQQQPHQNQAQPQSQQTPQTQGLIPATCLLKNANWCASQLPSYTDEPGCWAASEQCYAQLDVCYKSAPPTGSKGCKEWEEGMCDVVQEGCKGGKWAGPPSLALGEGKGDGEGGVDEPLPAAANAGAGQGQSQGGGGEGNSGGDGDGDDADDAAAAVSASGTSTSTVASAAVETATEAVGSGNGSCRRSRRDRRRRGL